ncbi:MAG: hypothetical protein H7326_11635 [Bdellovibrionaceae bacterium]|nr:hypothetical protein [Pseudobdellovibrionaceae bacterium]
MKLILALTATITMLFTAGCKEGTETIVVAGDSWAMFVCSYKSLDNALTKANVSGQSTNANCLSTTRASMRAEEQVLFETIQHQIGDATSAYLTARPDLKILISGYDYPRFSDDNKIDAYCEAYADMGCPTPAELNQFLNRFAESMTKFVDHKNTFYIQHHGLMQHYLGNEDANLKAFVMLAPEQISSADQPARFGGDDRLQTEEKGMLRIGPLTDAFHLSKFGFDKLAEHSVTQYSKSRCQVLFLYAARTGTDPGTYSSSSGMREKAMPVGATSRLSCRLPT